jgi:DNA-binding transcriptional ArsR family regulator
LFSGKSYSQFFHESAFRFLSRAPRLTLTIVNGWGNAPSDHPELTRLRVLQAVCHVPRTVNEIVEAVGATQANVSKHLALLAGAGILARQKDGQRVYCGMKDQLAMKLCVLVHQHLE